MEHKNGVTARTATAAKEKDRYELPGDESSAGVKQRFAFSLLLAGALTLIKNVFYPVQAASFAPENRGAGLEPQDLAGVADPDNLKAEDDTADNSGSDRVSDFGENLELEATSNLRSSSTNAGSHPRDLLVAPVRPPETTPAPSLLALTPVANNDNPVHFNFGPPPSALSGGGGDGGSIGSGGGASKRNGASNDPGDPDDTDTLDAEPGGEGGPRGNRSPYIVSSVVLTSLAVNQSAQIGLSSLLQGAQDPDGDTLSVQNLHASSGTLVEINEGAWFFSPDLNDAADVTFSYDISDGHSSVMQTAWLDLLPLSGRLINGTEDDDSLDGSPAGDTFYAGSGQDVVYGRDGDDIISGDDGNDRLHGGNGDDIIYGGAGDDIVYGGAGNDTIYGGEGDDELFGDAGDDVVFGEDGADNIHGGSGNDAISGGEGNDVVNAGTGLDVVEAGAGDDVIVAEILDGDDFYDGGTGSDTYDISQTSADAVINLVAGAAVSSEIGNDTIEDIENVIGGSGDDVIVASDVANVLSGGAGNDDVEAGAGEDIIIALRDDGDDDYDGGEDSDTYDISETSADAVINLATGHATSSEIGHDTIEDIENVIGGSGDDVIIASDSRNLLTGGDGDDVFVFQHAESSTGGEEHRDHITDFTIGDRIDISQIDGNHEEEGTQLFVLLSPLEPASGAAQISYVHEYFEGCEFTVVQGHTDDDMEVDFEIELEGCHEFSRDDFEGVA